MVAVGHDCVEGREAMSASAPKKTDPAEALRHGAQKLLERPLADIEQELLLKYLEIPFKVLYGDFCIVFRRYSFVRQRRR